MKLLSAHIENFGKLSNKTFDFADGINVFCEENGWGKSTLAAFLKVMFYGFEGDRVRDELDNERKKFKPWQGGVYGGSIRFKANEKVYRLNRTFGAKEAEDEFLLLDAVTGLASKDFTSNIGEELFGVDVTGFRRTVLLSQNECATALTDSINAKMGNLSDVTDDLNCYEEVMKRFKDEMNAMSPSRATGSIHKMQDEIDGLKKKIQNISVIEKQLGTQLAREEEYRIQRDSLKHEIRNLNRIQLYISEKSVKLLKEDTLGQLKEKEEERKQECERIKQEFAGNVPEPDVLNDAFKKAGDLRSKDEAVKLLALSEQERMEEQQAKLFFNENPFDEKVHRENEDKIDKFYDIRKYYEKTLLSQEERDKLDEYSVKYSESNYRISEIEELEKVWSEVELRRSSLMARKEAHSLLETEESQIQKKNQVSPVIFILPLIGTLIAAGLLVYFYIAEYSKLYLLCSGIPAGILLVVTLLMISKWYKRKKEKPIFLQSEEMKTQIVEEENTIRAMENNLIMRLDTKGLIGENEELSKCFWRIKAEYNEFGELSRRRENIRKDPALDTMKSYATELDAYLKGFLGDAYDETDLSAAINRLFAQNDDDVKLLDARRAKWMDAFGEIENASEKCRTYAEKRKQYNESVEERDALKNKLHEILKDMGVTPGEDIAEQIKTLQVELQSYSIACEEYALAKKERTVFEMGMKKEEEEEEKPEGWESGMTPESCERRIAECNEKLEDVSENMSALHNTILYAQEQLDELAAEEERLEVLVNAKEEAEKRYRMLQAAKEHFENAKNAFTATYIEPVSHSFEKYVKKLDSKGEYQFAFDAESKITVEEGGMPRSTRAFSTGMQDLFGICQRMAFIDAMYKDEKPMIVFDDPFTNLDADKIAGGLKFLEEISKEYQVIYFTCHKDRTGDGK